MASQLPVSQGGGDAGAAGSAALVGQAGQEYVQATLSTGNPQTAIDEIQSSGALRDPRCRPLLGLLDQLGLSRAESHRHVLQRATEELLARVATLPPDRLLRLLEVTFPFIGISDLRAVPLAVLDRLQPVPASFLWQLAVDRDLFWELPPGVQRQAWQLDRKLLQAHALPLVAAYTYETATAMQALNMDETLPAELAFRDLPAAAGRSPPKLPQLARRNLRNGSAALRHLTGMVGHSQAVYRGIVDLCVARLRDSEAPFVGMKEAALCALRSQLLMSLHDRGETGICSADGCHKLAWTLDACLKDRRLDRQRLGEMCTFFSALDPAEPRQPARAKAPRGAAHAQAQPRGGSASVRERDNDAESAGAPGAAVAADPRRELGDAAMALRDPAPFHLVLHQVVRCLERCVAGQAVPRNDKELVFLTRLLTLAVEGRAMLRERAFRFPEPAPELLDTFYPLVADFILEAALREGEEEEGEGGGAADPPPPPPLLEVLVRSEVGRRVVQTYALERLAAGDLVTARLVLRALAGCLDRLADLAVPEFAPFAFTLARRLASLHAAHRVTPDHPLWAVAVDAVLLRLVDAETEVHEEVLRLLLAAAPAMPAGRLAACLAATLRASRRSRKAHKKRAAGEAALPPGGYGGGGGGYASEGGGGYETGGGGYLGYETGGGGYLTAGGGAEGGAAAARGADGVRGTYHRFLQKQPELTAEVAPALHAYLQAAG